MRVKGWLSLLLFVLWTVTVCVTTWQTWPPTYVSPDSNAEGSSSTFDRYVPDDNNVNRANKTAALRAALKLWLLPSLVGFALGYGVPWAYRGVKAIKPDP
jgi:hypothetical protein